MAEPTPVPTDQLCPGIRVKLTVSTACSRFPEWMQGFHQFDSARLPLSDRHAMLTAYFNVVEPGEIGTIVGIHAWPDRVDYLVEYPNGLASVVPPDAIEFHDYGNLLLVRMPPEEM